MLRLVLLDPALRYFYSQGDTPPSDDYERYPLLVSVGTITSTANWRGNNPASQVSVTLLNIDLASIFADPPSRARVERYENGAAVTIFTGEIDSIKLSERVELGLVA